MKLYVTIEKKNQANNRYSIMPGNPHETAYIRVKWFLPWDSTVSNRLRYNASQGTLWIEPVGDISNDLSFLIGQSKHIALRVSYKERVEWYIIAVLELGTSNPVSLDLNTRSLGMLQTAEGVNPLKAVRSRGTPGAAVNALRSVITLVYDEISVLSDYLDMILDHIVINVA